MINRVCVFAHYDKDNIVDDYVYYYLTELMRVVQKLIFVTVSDIAKQDLKKLENLNIEVIKRKNIGYDFYSYKVGIERLDLTLYDELIICNDSVFGPLIPMQKIFTKMRDKECDIWGISDSDLIAYHLQSYFLVFRKSILQSEAFSYFWDELTVLDDKKEIIKRYEVGLSQALLKEGYSSKVYIQYKVNTNDNSLRLLKRLWKKPYKIFRLLFSPSRYYTEATKKSGNPSVSFWDTLLVKYQLPFIKKSLISDRSENTENMKKLRVIFQKNLLKSNYPSALIERYFIRVK